MTETDNQSPQAGAGTANIAVIIPHYNDVVRLERCLSALVGKGGEGGVPQEWGADVDVVVVDNNSTDDIGPLRAAFPAVRFVVEKKAGAAEARNRGVRETTAPILFFLDADCVPAPDWLDAGRRVAGNADVIGGRIDTFDETAPPRSGAEAFEAVFAFHQRDYIERQGFSVTANLITSRAVFDATGEFRPGVSEDRDWCLRAGAKGFKLVHEDSLRVSHPTRSDWPALAKKWKRLSSEGFHLSGTDAAARIRWALRAIAVALSAFAHIPKVMTSPALSSTIERVRGIGTLFRIRLWRAGYMIWQAAGGE